MAAQLSLRISLEGGRVTKTIQFDPNTTVFDACRIIRDKFADAIQGQGEFLSCFSIYHNAKLLFLNVIYHKQPPNLDCFYRMRTLIKAFGLSQDETSDITCSVISMYSNIDAN
jgi:hypothetical protein